MEIIKGGLAVDDRGAVRFVNSVNFQNVKRFYQIENHQQGFIRAWHGHFRETKYIYVARGAARIGVAEIKITAVNASENNLEFDISIGNLVWQGIISDVDPKVLYIPPGHANGIQTLAADTIVMCFSTSTLEESKEDDHRFPYDTWDIWKAEYR